MTEGAQEEEGMSNAGSASAVTAEAIETAFDGRWGIWLSCTGRWWAKRQDGPSVTGPDTAGVLLVRADDPDQLRARIQEQESLPARTPPPGPGAGWQTSVRAYGARTYGVRAQASGADRW
jgi:hypothetical protein